MLALRPVPSPNCDNPDQNGGSGGRQPGGQAGLPVVVQQVTGEKMEEIWAVSMKGASAMTSAVGCGALGNTRHLVPGDSSTTMISRSGGKVIPISSRMAVFGCVSNSSRKSGSDQAFAMMRASMDEL